MDKTPFVTPYISMEIKNDILYFTYLRGGIVRLDTAKEIVKQRLEYTNSTPYPLLIIGEGLKIMDKQSRDYFAGKEGVEGVAAAAIVVDSVYNQFFGNMFLSLKIVAKVPMPVKSFSNRQEALNWLEQYKPKS